MTTQCTNGKSIRIVLTGDTHGRHRDLSVPAGDLLIHTGDFTIFSQSLQGIEDLNSWLGEQSHPHKVLVPGNHEFALVALTNRGLIDNAILLINETIEIMGLRIWGSPTTPMHDGAFGISNDSERERIYSHIPDGTDIVITHGPPFGLLDGAEGTKEHLGCRQLLNAVCRVQPTIHVFGHVHAGYGTTMFADTLFANAASAGPDGNLIHPPIIVDLEMPKEYRS